MVLIKGTRMLGEREQAQNQIGMGDRALLIPNERWCGLWSNFTSCDGFARVTFNDHCAFDLALEDLVKW